MSIFLNENSKVIVQGITGSEGMKHGRRMLAAGTNVVGGVNPRKAGTTVDFDGTNAEAGRAILDGANNPLVERVDTMDGAAERAAELAAAGK